MNRDLNALPDSRGLSGRNCRESLILGLFAGLATFRLVFEALIVKEDLLSCSPRKILTAIYAFDRKIVVLNRTFYFTNCFRL